MLESKSMATPMNSNLKLLNDSSSDLVDPTVYRHLIGSLMYLVNTRLDICFAVNSLSQYMVDPSPIIPKVSAPKSKTIGKSSTYFKLTSSLDYNIVEDMNNTPAHISMYEVAKIITQKLHLRKMVDDNSTPTIITHTPMMNVVKGIVAPTIKAKAKVVSNPPPINED